MSARARFWSLAFVAALVSGCAHYRLGDSAKPSFSSLYVAPVKIKALVPQGETILSIHMREAFERDGRISLASDSPSADASLEVTVVEYRREIAANREDDTGLARKFVLILTTSCSLKDNRTGKYLFEKRLVSVRREAFTDNAVETVAFGTSNDQTQAEYNTLPFLADALGDKVTHLVLDVW